MNFISFEWKHRPVSNVFHMPFVELLFCFFLHSAIKWKLSQQISWTQNFDRKWKTIFLTSYYCFSTRLPFLRIFYLFLFPSYENVFIFDAKWIMKNGYEKILLAFNSGSSWLREKKRNWKNVEEKEVIVWKDKLKNKSSEK